MKHLLIALVLLAAAGFAGVISEPLQLEMAQAAPGQLIPVLIKPAGRADLDYINSVAAGMNSAERREFAVAVLKDFAEEAQRPLLEALEAMPAGSVSDVQTNWIVNAVGCWATPEAIRQISLRGDVEWVNLKTRPDILIEPVNIREPRREELDLANAWGVDKINAPDVWALGYEGQGVIVAVVDTGVNYNHNDLHNNMWHDTPAGYHYGWNFANGTGDPMDTNGHGTHTAGTVGGDGTSGTQTGVAPQATIMALKTSMQLSDEQQCWDAYEFAIEHGASVVSSSFGWQQSWNPARQTWREAVENSLAAGVHHSIAAGNEGGNPGTYGDIRTPGDCPPPWLHPDQTTSGGLTSVVTVGATDSNDNIASFSSVGYSTWKFDSPWFDYPDTAPEIGLIDPDISAPGVDIVSCSYSNPSGYTTMSGTSMATPHIAGCMALMLSANPELTNAQMDSLLEMTAVDRGATGKDNIYGAGRVDIYQAVLAALELVGTEEESGAAVEPAAMVLSGVSPNPAGSHAGFSLYVPAQGSVTVNIFDVAGRAVASVHSGELASGSHSFIWSVPENLGNGIYFIRAAGPGGQAVSRMTLLR
jgi:subtilisin family serine protease